MPKVQCDTKLSLQSLISLIEYSKLFEKFIGTCKAVAQTTVTIPNHILTDLIGADAVGVSQIEVVIVTSKSHYK